MTLARPLSVLLLGLAAAGLAHAESTPLPETPPTARPGECFGLVYVPPTYTTRTETVLVQPAGERVEVVPAVYEWVEETKQLPARRVRRIVTPAKTESYEETVPVPERSRRVPVPAQYKTLQERVPGPPVTVLKPGKNLPGQDQDGIFCLTETPGSERLVEKRVLVRPATTRTVTTPAGSKVVRRQKVIEPAVTEWVDLPPRTVTRKVKRLLAPASERRVPTEATYAEVVHREVATAGHAEWRSILCEDNLTPSLVRDVQRALAAKGFYSGPLDGRIGSGTEKAIRQFQTIEELPSGPLSAQTLQALGVTPSAVY